MQKSFPKYVLFFGLVYIGMTVLFAVISSFVSSAGSTGSVIAPFLAAMVVGQIFVKSEKRAPNNEERNRLTFFSFGVFLVINISLISLAFSAGAFDGVFSDGDSGGPLLTMFAVIFTVLLLIVFFMMRWAYGGLTQKFATKILEDQQNTFD